MYNLGYGMDPTMLLLIPTFLLAMYAQFKVKSTFNKFSNIGNRRGITGAEVAEQLLAQAGIGDVHVEHVKGNLTDHYDPRDKTLRLSDAVYNSSSLSAIGVAAHETGHAIQHDLGYSPLVIRNAIVPVVGFSSNLAMPLIFIGLFLSSSAGAIGMLMVNIGILLFTGVVIFQVITLPVEFNASSRAIELLDENGFLVDEELTAAKKVLNAAALTYVAAAASSIANLIRFLLLSNSRRRD